MFDNSQRLKTLDWLVPDARAAFQALIAEAKRRGYLPSIVSAVRTCAEETNLASNKSGKVKRSWHVLGRAVDIELHLGAPADDPAKFYRELAAWWEQQGGTWGGRWETSFQPFPGVTTDVMHFQWTPGMGDAPPRTVWPDGLDCDQVDAIQAAVLGRSATSPAPSSPGPSSGSSSPPATSPNNSPAPPQKKNLLPTLEQASAFYWLGVALRRASRFTFGAVELAAGGP